MTAHDHHDEEEAQAKDLALHAALLAREAADLYDEGRVRDALQVIRHASAYAEVATQQDWPFLSR